MVGRDAEIDLSLPEGLQSNHTEVGFGRYHGNWTGQVFTIIILTVAACEALVLRDPFACARLAFVRSDDGPNQAGIAALHIFATRSVELFRGAAPYREKRDEKSCGEKTY